MLAAILKNQIHELGANVEKILYAKNPVEIRKILLWSAAILDTAAMLAAILKNKVDENHLGTERILRAENRVKIRYRLGEEAGHRRGQAHTQMPEGSPLKS